jgi:hypothetical protein
LKVIIIFNISSLFLLTALSRLPFGCAPCCLIGLLLGVPPVHGVEYL